MSSVFLKIIKLFSVKIFIGLCLVGQASANDYKAGLAAYIDGDFGLAQQHWLEAANQKDAKSMFNLGLLHEQNKLENSSIEKALNWYRLAADNGYPAAGYHLAQRMLERGGSDDDAMALIRVAADKDYVPAKRHLGFEQASDSRTPSGVEANTVKQPEEGKSAYQSENWINRQRGENWTIQLLAFRSKEQVLAFIDLHRLQSDAAYFSESKGGEVFYKLVYGSYDSKFKATFARQNLSDALQEHGPWLRTLSSVQQITKR